MIGRDYLMTYATSRPLWRRVVMRLELAWCRWQLRSIVDEVNGYEDAGVKLGPVYLINCENQARDLRARISVLEFLL